jgi:hypothetical protein
VTRSRRERSTRATSRIVGSTDGTIMATIMMNHMTDRYPHSVRVHPVALMPARAAMAGMSAISAIPAASTNR